MNYLTHPGTTIFHTFLSHNIVQIISPKITPLTQGTNIPDNLRQKIRWKFGLQKHPDYFSKSKINLLIVLYPHSTIAYRIFWSSDAHSVTHIKCFQKGFHRYKHNQDFSLLKILANNWRYFKNQSLDPHAFQIFFGFHIFSLQMIIMCSIQWL